VLADTAGDGKGESGVDGKGDGGTEAVGSVKMWTSAVFAGSPGEVAATAEPVATRTIGTDASAISPARRWLIIGFLPEDPRWSLAARPAVADGILVAHDTDKYKIGLRGR
jgi:hypothetical protein